MGEQAIGIIIMIGMRAAAATSDNHATVLIRRSGSVGHVLCRVMSVKIKHTIYCVGNRYHGWFLISADKEVDGENMDNDRSGMLGRLCKKKDGRSE